MGFSNEFGKGRRDVVDILASRLGCGAVQDLEFESFALLKLSSSGISGDGVGSGEERSGLFMVTLACKAAGVAGKIVEPGEVVLSGELESC